MSKFRPCIDLHNGQVKQIVGSSLTDKSSQLTENFVADKAAAWFAKKYREDNLIGGHVIKLGPGNEQAAEEAIRAFPNGMQIGGGVTDENASYWLDAGASHVILTSWLFEDACFQIERLKLFANKVGKDKIVVDLSCKKTDVGWTVAKDRWQTLTDLNVTHATLDQLIPYCDEFLIHAADVEGKCEGIDEDLVELMGSWGKIPMTYAGGIASMEDIQKIKVLGNGKIDFTVGSALDLFGGSGVQYRDLVDTN